jgi:hypothetical protein
MDKLALKRYVEANERLIARRETSYPGLYVLKYKRRVFFDDIWNQFTEECRGTIVDADYNVVSRPFTKIFNYGIESRAPRLPLDTVIRAYRKVNGFMVAMTMVGDELLVSTTGSTDSPFVAMAKEQMQKMHSWQHWVDAIKLFAGYTMMFECVHVNDPHIIPEPEGMYFLGWRKNGWDSKVDGYGFGNGDWEFYAKNHLKCYFPEMIETTLGELVALTKTVRHEGFVFYDEKGVSSKIKSPYYLVNKFVARNPRTDKLMSPDVKRFVDEEYYPLVDHIQANIAEYTSLDEQARLKWVREFLEK